MAPKSKDGFYVLLGIAISRGVNVGLGLPSLSPDSAVAGKQLISKLTIFRIT